MRLLSTAPNSKESANPPANVRYHTLQMALKGVLCVVPHTANLALACPPCCWGDDVPSPSRPVTDMTTTPFPQQNRLLAALSSEVQTRLFPHLELISLPLGKAVYESGDTLRHVYFPTDSIVSLLYVTADGASAEISVVGNDGVVGIALFMGGESTPSRACVQSAGNAYRLQSQRLKKECNRHGELLNVMLRYTQLLITQVAQTAVCNRHHSIDQQLCRWLLLSLDRLSGDHIIMTQELIANMLGVRREGVTDAAGKLQRLGVIEYSRGHIRVLDRKRLERLSCECYAVVKREAERLLPYVPSFKSIELLDSSLSAQCPETNRGHDIDAKLTPPPTAGAGFRRKRA
jgi:CRP-like cAMP-binding protein